MKTRRWAALTLLPLAALAALAAAAPVPDTMAQRLQACTVCHGKEGRATREGYFPRIAGKPAGYLFNQLVNFRDGRRHNATMAYLVEHMPDEYLREIAGYFAALDLPYAVPPPATAAAAQWEQGAALVRQGDARRGIPACMACHGERMTGVQPAVPGLLGLPRDYVLGQLGAWQTGQRRAAVPDCMSTIARRLTPQDVSAVAAWLSSQPAPLDTQPAPQARLPLPLECGSGLQ
jgi:cytochrome c553